MDGTMIGFAAVVLTCGIPIAAFYTYYRVRLLASKERMTALEKGLPLPVESVLPPHARSRRVGILLVAGSLGYTAMFYLISRYEPDALVAASFGALPLALGIGYFIDATLLRREAHAPN
jgi:hypothetical protein